MRNLLKSFSPLVVFVFLFMGSGCGGGGSDTTNTAQNPTSQATPNSGPTITLRAQMSDASFISSSLSCHYTLLDFTGNPLVNDSATVTPTETEFVVAKISGVDPSAVAMTVIVCHPAASSQRNFILTTDGLSVDSTFVGVTLEDTKSVVSLVPVGTCDLSQIFTDSTVICDLAQMVIDRCADPSAPLICENLFVTVDSLTASWECPLTDLVAKGVIASSFFSCGGGGACAEVGASCSQATCCEGLTCDPDTKVCSPQSACVPPGGNCSQAACCTGLTCDPATITCIPQTPTCAEPGGPCSAAVPCCDGAACDATNFTCPATNLCGNGTIDPGEDCDIGLTSTCDAQGKGCDTKLGTCKCICLAVRCPIGGCTTPESNCTNGCDDDGDGLIDCADPDCKGTAACPATPAPAPSPIPL